MQYQPFFCPSWTKSYTAYATAVPCRRPCRSVPSPHSLLLDPLKHDIETAANELVLQYLLYDLVCQFVCLRCRVRVAFVPLAVVGCLWQAQVIPGGSEEFNAFIRQNLHTQRPDVFLGILQSAFILGARRTVDVIRRHETT